MNRMTYMATHTISNKSACHAAPKIVYLLVQLAVWCVVVTIACDNATCEERNLYAGQ